MNSPIEIGDELDKYNDKSLSGYDTYTKSPELNTEKKQTKSKTKSSNSQLLESSGSGHEKARYTTKKPRRPRRILSSEHSKNYSPSESIVDMSRRSSEKIDEIYKSLKFNSESQYTASDTDRGGQSNVEHFESSSKENVPTLQTPCQNEKNFKKESDWAEKLFCKSTDMIFPGFSSSYGGLNKQIDVAWEPKPSAFFQIMLYGDSYFFLCWIVSFLLHSDLIISTLKALHGYLIISFSILFILINFVRLWLGINGNENNCVKDLALFWMSSVIVEMPLLLFMLATDFFSETFLPFTSVMDTVLMSFLLIESVIGFRHLRSILTNELMMIKLAKRFQAHTDKLRNIRNNEPNHAEYVGNCVYKPEVVNTIEGPKIVWQYENPAFEHEIEEPLKIPSGEDY